jgi:hypothetical protein
VPGVTVGKYTGPMGNTSGKKDRFQSSVSQDKLKLEGRRWRPGSLEPIRQNLILERTTTAVKKTYHIVDREAVKPAPEPLQVSALVGGLLVNRRYGQPLVLSTNFTATTSRGGFQDSRHGVARNLRRLEKTSPSPQAISLRNQGECRSRF